MIKIIIIKVIMIIYTFCHTNFSLVSLYDKQLVLMYIVYTLLSTSAFYDNREANFS